MTKASPPASAATCPSCERYIGPVLECPYCGAEARGRLPLRALRWGALVFGIGGLAALVVAAHHTELPLVRAADIAPSMNYGRVRIQGKVASVPRILDKGGQPDYVSFDVDDGSGRITIAASRRAARRLVSENKVPALGTRVEASGSLSVEPERRPRLYLDAPSQLTPLDEESSPGPSRAQSLPPPTGAKRETS